MARIVLDRLCLALWLAGFVLLTIGFLLRLALGAALPAARPARTARRSDETSGPAIEWPRALQG